MINENHRGSNIKWIIQYIVVPIIVAFIAGGAGTAVIVSIRNDQPIIFTPLVTPTAVAVIETIETFTSDPIDTQLPTPTVTPNLATETPTNTTAPTTTDTSLLIATNTPISTATPGPPTATTINTPKAILPTSTFTPVPATIVPRVQVVVDARGGWQDTNVEISTNDLLTIQYVGGDWTGNVNNPERSQGENAPWVERTEGCLPVQGQGSSLVGRIDSGTSFVVGQYFSDRILSSGRLELRMNDCDQWLVDNDGAITISILVIR